MKRFFFIVLAAFALMFAYSCEKDDPKTTEPEEKPTPAPVPVVNVASVTLNKTTLEMTEGDSTQLTATVAPSDATNKKVTWSSSNATTASVSNTGKVKALTPGTAVITVKSEDGGKTATCNVTVKTKIPKDVENVSDLKFKLNTAANQFTVTWSGVKNATGYKCWYINPFDAADKFELEVTMLEDSTWTSGSNMTLSPSTYVVNVEPIPAEGHALKNDTPASVQIVIPELKLKGIYYRHMSKSVEKGVEYECESDSIVLKYMNIQYQTPESVKVVKNGWYLYTATPIEKIHHLEMWYGATYNNSKPSIRVYSGVNPGEKKQQLVPDGKLMSGYWKVFYAVPEGHKYIYVEGETIYDYFSHSGSHIYHF